MEIWKAIPGYEGRYEVSDQGRVRSLYKKAPSRILRGCRHKYGYPMVTLWKDSQARTETVHRLVIETFVGPAPEGHECAHLNGDPTNPQLSNLAWVTRQENMDHMLLHGTRRFGSKHHLSKLNEDKVRQIKQLFGTMPQDKIAARFGVSRGAINAIAIGRTWRNV